MNIKIMKLFFIFTFAQTILLFAISQTSWAYTKVTDGTVTASSYYSGYYYYGTYYSTSDYVVSHAVDGDSTSVWSSASGTPHWLRNQLPTAKVVTKYRMQIQNTGYSFPIAWTLQGSNNGTSWTTIDTRSNQTPWTGGEWRDFIVQYPASYLYYQIYVTQVEPYGLYTYLILAEFELYTGSSNDGCDCTIPSGTLTNPKNICTGNYCSSGTTTVPSNGYVAISATGIVTLSPGFTATSGSKVDIFGGDSDADGLMDSWELANFGGSLSQSGTGDYDGDELFNFWEFLLGYNPKSQDLDNDEDGIPDWIEIMQNEGLNSEGTCDCN